MSVSQDTIWQLAEQFIEQANAALDQHDISDVNAALLLATTQFNAFSIDEEIKQTEDADWDVEKDTALRAFTKQYRQLLEDSVDAYSHNESDDT